MKNTTSQGNEFRDGVRQLLSLTPGCTGVEIEKRLGTQPVDIYYEENTTFGRVRVACECKDYREPLTKSYIASNIYGRYRPLLDKKLVDAVRIIAPLELGEIAQEYVTEVGFSFSTVNQVESQLMDFSRYLHSLRAGFSDDGLDQYYERPTFKDGQDLEQRVCSWIEGTSSQPLAILAGYGMGKTSFARRLAFLLSDGALKKAGSRIPILVPLSEVSSEQTLEGLIGKLLAAQYRVSGYHFESFKELSQRGRFVIILDGFDEMKHALSWSEFQHNFRELNRLHGPRSRVVLLGRPSAFLSDDEGLWVLRGKRRDSERMFTVPGAPEYDELRLRPFKAAQALDFIRRYSAYRLKTTSRRSYISEADFKARIDSIESDSETMNLAARPVQARILADLAIDPEVNWRHFSRYQLYREFIERITERETDKTTRMAFPSKARVQFIRHIAWWIWRRANAPSFKASEIPAPILAPLVPNPDVDPEGVRRDLVSGSILERKAGDRYYFPHQSFLEFLVAEYMCLEDANLPEYSTALTPEVVDFIKESDHVSKVADWANVVNEVRAPLSWALLELIAWAQNRLANTPRSSVARAAPPRDVLLDYLRASSDAEPSSRLLEHLDSMFENSSLIQSRLACLLGLLHLAATHRTLAGDAVKRVMAKALAMSFRRFPVLSEHAPRHVMEEQLRDPILRALLFSFKAIDSGAGAPPKLLFDVAAFRRDVERSMDPGWRVLEFRKQEADVFVEFMIVDLATLEPVLDTREARGPIRDFFEKYPDPTSLLRYASRIYA